MHLKLSDKRVWPVLLFAIFHIVIFMVIFQGAFPDESEYPNHAEGDSRSLYYSYANQIFDGDLPYQDFDIEYAPLSLPLFLLPRLLAQSDLNYHIVFAAQMLIFDLVGLMVIASLTKRFGYSLWGVLTFYTIGLLALGPTVIDHFDLAASIMVLLAFYCVVRGWNSISWMMLALGTMIKIFPIVIVPIFALYLLWRKEYRDILKGGMAFAFTLIVVSIPCMIIDAGGYIDSFTYHSDRGLQAESTYSSLIFLGDFWGITTIETDFIDKAGSWDMITPLADTFANIAPLIVFLSLALVYGAYTQKRWRPGQLDAEIQHKNLITYSTLALIIFLITNKVFSPQYVIWLYPLIPIIAVRWKSVLIVFFAAIALATQYIFSYHYDYIFSDHYLDLVYYHETTAIMVLIVRNFLLIAMVILFFDWQLPISKLKKRQT
ncbi:MAG: DUF2029 domain-containing protein [Chloroflexi bacterium]|jgi:uncharacterized membrane protein|nr:DUF2029 domain-containing protein [Chloroflexota bacterium]